MVRGGQRHGAGRHRLFRTHSITIRISEELYNFLQSVPNKTELVNELLYSYKILHGA